MNEVMTYERWMKYTDGGITSIRSGQLKAVDAALDRYKKVPTPANLDTLRTALVGWMQKEGPGWRNSIRNRYHAVSDLYGQVMGLPTARKTGRDIVAVSHLKAESREIINSIFQGKSLEWRSDFIGKLADNKFGVTGNAPKAVKNAATLGTPGGSGRASKLAQDVFDTLVPAEVRSEVMQWLVRVLPDFMTELTAAMVPFVGLVTAGGTAVYNGLKVLRGQYRIEVAQMHQQRSLSANEPAAALDALVRLLERERNYDAISATVSTAEFAGKLAGVLADGGTATNAAVGLAANVAKLTNIIRVVTRDVLERREANKRMRELDVDVSIFEVCPIVGAYLVCCAPTSVLVNTVLERFWERGWRGDVERTAQRHIPPLQEQARRVIQIHRFYIPALQNFPGMLVVNEKKLEEMEKRKGKSGMEGFGWDNMPENLRS